MYIKNQISEASILSTKIIETTDKAVEWNNSAAIENIKIKNDQLDNYHSFLKIKLQAKKINSSLNRSPCVGVFGPSQAGKSYLVSTLAKGKKGNLTVELGNETVDFLQRINPSGGRESTGVVTRFSMKKSVLISDKFPVEIRLLSESDVLKILINSFYSDLDHAGSIDLKPISDEEIRSRLAPYANHVIHKNVFTTLHHEDVLDVKLYLEASFGNFASNLKADFWPTVIKLAPYLTVSDKANLFSIIWRDFDVYTDLYKILITEITKLKGAEICFAPIDSVVSDRGQVSIVDAQLLSKLADSDIDNLDIFIQDERNSSTTVNISRSVLAALTAELNLNISDAKWDFLNNLDILDFPGARSRKNLTLKDLNELKSDPQLRNSQTSELFLRGKVAFLFQRYTADQEMSAVILCVPGGPQEVGYAPLINQWVCEANGESPEKRKNHHPGLLFVLTKFDEELKAKGGDNELNERARWANRMESSLLEKFKNYEWINKWDDRPFNNLFWLRNPEIKSSTFMKYENGYEVSINSEDTSRLERLRQYFIEDKNVALHFKNPQLSWDSAMTPQDGGISLLVKSIDKLADPLIRIKNLEDKLFSLKELLNSKLRPYFNEGADEEVKKKQEIVKIIKKELFPLIKRSEIWKLFDNLNLSLYDLKSLYYLVNSSANESQSSNLDGSVSDDSSDNLDNFLNDQIDGWTSDKDEKKGTSDLGVHPRALAYATKVIDTWATKLRDWSANSVNSSALYCSVASLSLLVEEIISAAYRVNLISKLSIKLDASENNAGATWEKIIDRQMTIAYNFLSDFIYSFENTGLTATTNIKELDTFNIDDKESFLLTEKPLPVIAITTKNWISELERTIVENAGFLSKDALSVNLNNQLGSIILHLNA